MENTIKNFLRKVDEATFVKKKKIGFGMKMYNETIADSLKRASKFAEVVVIVPLDFDGPKNFSVIRDANPEEKLAAMLVSGELDGIVRGTIDDFKTLEHYKKLTNEKCLAAPALFRIPGEYYFLLGLVTNTEGYEKEERLFIAQTIASFLKKSGIDSKIAVFAGTRHETYERKSDVKEGTVGYLNKTYEDAEWIVKKLKDDGYVASNYTIDVDVAIKDGYNILLPVNGLVANQIFHLLFVFGGQDFGIRIGFSKIYIDNSRNETNFEPHIKFACALANSNSDQGTVKILKP